MKELKIRKRLIYINLLILFLFVIGILSADKQNDDLLILGIEPNSGSATGDTRVMVRLKLLDEKKVLEYPHPRCRFGSKESEVEAVYVKCTPNPRTINEPEAEFDQRTDICVQCGNTKPHSTDIVPFTVSLVGDFTDTLNSIPFRFYDDPVVKQIFPEAGPQNGGTKVEVTGENFLNYDQNLRCSFGTRVVKAIYVSTTKLICYTPPSDVVEKKMPFAVTFNFQQKSKEDINFVYYETPQIFSLEPGRGPDVGGTVIRLFGQNFHPYITLPDFGERNKIKCRFDGKDEGSGILISSTYVQCTVPPSRGRIKTIPEISLNRRDFHKNEKVAFYYYHAPYITSISPKSIAPNGGTEVVVTGTLCKPNDHILCKFANVTVEGTYINEEKLSCISPKIGKPGKVPFAVSCKDGEDSVGTFLNCFEDPIVEEIIPKTGPEYGHTQILVRGKKFPQGCSEAIKCSFNRTILTDATVMDNETLYCDSPNVLNNEGNNILNVSNYDLEVTMDEGKVFHGKKQKFEYYKQHTITSVSPKLGPVEGGTIVKIAGKDFSELKNKNVTVRFATYSAEIIKIEKDIITVKSPKANYTGPTYIQIAFNGQQYDEINHNENNSFTYHKWPHITDIDMLKGSTNCENDIKLSGLNFIKAYDTNKNNIEILPENADTIYYRFVDENNDNIKTEVKESKPNANDELILKSPIVTTPKKTKIELSYNNQNFKKYDDYIYEFIKLPQIKSIKPKFLPLEQAGKEKIVAELDDDYYCETKECKAFKCRFKSNNGIFYTEGHLTESTKVECLSPKSRNPDQFDFEISPGDNQVYTHSGQKFAYYSPYVMKVEPKMIASKGGTLVNIYGYGFANTSEELQALYGAEKPEDGLAINCNKYACKKQAEFVDSTYVRARSFPRSVVRLNETGEKLQYEHFPVEVAVWGGDFTNNNVTIFYFDEPEIIDNLDEFNDENIYNEEEKLKIKPALIKSFPSNTETYIPIPINGTNIKNRYNELEPYLNYTCSYIMENGNEYIKRGILTSYPYGTDKYNLFLCESPNFEQTGNCEVRISINGYDYTEKAYNIEFTDPLHIYKMEPTCGPNEGNTEMEFIGTGFRNEDNFVFKWGPQNVVPMKNPFIYEDASEKDKNLYNLNSCQFPLKKIKIHSPMALHPENTTGGPDYISIDKINMLPLNELLEDYKLNSFKNQEFEYFYYHQVYIDSYSPNIADPTDPTLVTVIGAFFKDKPEYNVKPICRFGDTNVVGTYKSNVRITCLSPEYHKANIKVPFSVSLNGKDFIQSEEPFTFAAALKNANFGKINPKTGPTTGGTIVSIPARGLGNVILSDLDNKNQTEDGPIDVSSVHDISTVYCLFQSVEDEGLKKESPGKIEVNPENGSNEIVCSTPGGWNSGTRTKVLANFGGDKWIDTGNEFFFFTLEDIVPSSGPNCGGGYISLDGAGFMLLNNTELQLDKTYYKAVNMSGNNIQFPLPPSKEPNYVGPVDIAIAMDGKNQMEISEGFYYYEQINTTSFYPTCGPAKGKGKIVVSGKNFRSDFKGANPSCKIGNYYGTGEVLSNQEMLCTFEELPVLRSKPGQKVEDDPGFPFETALNNYSFVESQNGQYFKGYTINYIQPSSGPITGNTKILVHGSGFVDTGNIRCRFGTPGWYSITQADFIDSATITCNSPENFPIPKEGQLPFNVPFAVAFNEDEFEPWTSTSHTFSFYVNPKIIDNDPREGKTSEIKTVIVQTDKTHTLSIPSPIIYEDNYEVLGENSTKLSNNKFEYQPIKCKYGRFGTTDATYINKTHLSCLTPAISNDKDIAYEKVDLEVALNGQDFISGDEVDYTFIGPAADKMVWVYILMILFIAILAVILILLATTFWNKIGVTKDEGSQVRNKRIKYLIDQNLEELGEQDQAFREPGLN